MKHLLRNLLVCLAICFIYCSNANSQAIKTNIPLIVTGNPNIGVEWSVGSQFTLNADILWAPYLFKSDEEVFRTLIGSVDFRYYINPKYYYVNDMWDGFYVGPYAMYGNYNIGLYDVGKKYIFDAVYDDEGNLVSGKEEGIRRKGWGISGGISTGYKFYLSSRFRMDINIGLGYAHLQYDKYRIGGEWASKDYRMESKKTKAYVGPTKFGIHLVYNIFR